MEEVISTRKEAESSHVSERKIIANRVFCEGGDFFFFASRIILTDLTFFFALLKTGQMCGSKVWLMIKRERERVRDTDGSSEEGILPIYIPANPPHQQRSSFLLK